MSITKYATNTFDSVWVDAVEYALAGGTEWPWQFSPRKTLKDGSEPWQCQFTHLLYSDGEPQSPFIEVVRPLLEHLNPVALYRIKANLTVVTDSTRPFEWHSDSDDSRCTTALYYANSTDGFTEFEDGSRVDCVKGHLITFPSTLRHRTWTHTDTAARCVINMIYF